jgi:predicted DCC family thiol-disulfide oxidoreductase YuxK
MKKNLTIFYDNFCPNCTRFTKLIQKLDWFKFIKIKQLRNPKDLNSAVGIDKNLAEKQMASFNGKWHYGFVSIYLIALRLPLFWVFIPVLYVLKISKIGQFFYTELAIKRKIIPIHCSEESCVHSSF